MKLQVDAEAFQEALTTVSVVTPASGFLIEAVDGKLFLSAQDDARKIRVECAALKAETGKFVLPTQRAATFKHLEGTVTIDFLEEDGAPTIKIEDSEGTSQSFITLNPLAVKPISTGDLVGLSTFPAAILKAGLSAVKHSVAGEKDQKVNDINRIVQLFDVNSSDADGYLYACNKTCSGYFFSPLLKSGRGFTVHVLHLPLLLQFLARCAGTVELSESQNYFYLTGDTVMFGWAKTAESNPKLPFYGLEHDKYLLRFNKEQLVKVLRQLRASLDAKEDRIRMTYTAEGQTLGFLGADAGAKVKSRQISVTAVEGGIGGGAENTDFVSNMNLNMFLEIAEHLDSPEAVLRVLFRKEKPQEGETEGHTKAFFRIFDDFKMLPNGKVASKEGAEGFSECRTIRAMPSRR